MNSGQHHYLSHTKKSTWIWEPDNVTIYARQISRLGVLYFTVPTWLQRVLDVEHGGPVAIHQVLLNLIFGNVAASIFYSYARFQVIEVAPIQLEELDEQNTHVDVWTAHVLPVVKLENKQLNRMSEFL